MSILAAGGEMGFFKPATSNEIERTTAISGGGGASFDSAFARCSTIAYASSGYIETVEVAAQTDFWIRGDIDQYNPQSTGSYQTAAEILDSSGNVRVRLRANWIDSGNNSTWDLQYWDGATFTSVGTITIANNTLQTVDIHVVANSASGSVDLYVASNLRIASGTIDTSAVDDCAQARFYGRTSLLNDRCAYSQGVISSTTTIGMRVGTIVPTGQGATHTFTTGGFGLVDETLYSDADAWNSATADQVELVTGTPIPSFTDYIISGIAVSARVKKAGSGPTQFQFALRSAGTTYFSPTIALDFGYGAYCYVWETNPATGVAFLSSEIAALEYGIKSIA